MTNFSASHVNLDLASALGFDVTDRRLAILRQVQLQGSISAAARQVGVSYKAAWQALDTLGNLVGQPVVQTNLGGAGGGGAQVTSAGMVLISAHQALQAMRQQVLQHGHSETGDEATSAQNLFVTGSHFALSGWRTSMRNQVPCFISALSMERSVCLVTLQLVDGQRLQASITHQSAQLLDLAPKMAVIAMFKATAVSVTASEEGREGDRHGLLKGVMIDEGATQGPTVGEEVAFELACGQRVVGLCHAGRATPVPEWRPGQPVMGRVSPESVVLVLPG